MENELLREIYEKYQREIYIYIYSICQNKALAEDILQETFLKALLSLPNKSFNLRAWLYKVARNLTLNELKKQKRSVPLEEISDDAFYQNFPSQNKELLDALCKLEPRKKEVLLLQYVASLSQKEIARILNLSLENVRVLSFRGRNELKKLLEGKNHDI